LREVEVLGIKNRGIAMKKYLIPLFFVLLSCGEHSFDEETLQNLFGTGLLLAENPETIQQDIKSFSDASASGFPKVVSLEDKFPPVGNQGSYGTCAVWSTGYALKTALNAIEKNWSPSDLIKAENQTSPRDVWKIIPLSNVKGEGCWGAVLSAVMDALISKGAASMAEAPYNNKMEEECELASDGDPNNKLANYRRIAQNYEIWNNSSGIKPEGMDVENFKTYLAQGRPILITGMIGERFINWNSSAVLSVDKNKRSLHAMVLSGYDDTKGSFRVRNSWGNNWADKGSIWVEYNFFLTEFLIEAYVAQNHSSPDNPPLSDVYDLLANYAEDYPDPENKTNPRARTFFYEIYNKGTKDILASQKWGVYYMYYNAYNANEYKIIHEDYYTDERGQPCSKPEDFDNQVCWGKYENTEAIAGGIWNNMNIKPGKMAGEAETGEYGFEVPYTMPNITGNYYLVAYADYKDVIKEGNEDNNMYFISDKDGKPLKFINGVVQTTPANSSAVLGKRQRPAPVHSVVDLGELNAYTPQEIKTLLNRDKKNGTLAKKIAEYRENPANPVKRIRKKRIT
jgi:hypothetical protein